MSLSAAGPHACPFVALADDRDARSTSPDQAHRCYAEERPEPRPLSHQRAYCLTREYAVCPYFLEWAGRLAARKVGQALEPFPTRYEAPIEERVGGPLHASAGSQLGMALGAPVGTADVELGLAPSRRRRGITSAVAGTGMAPDLVDPEEIEEIDEAGRLVDRVRWPVGPGRGRGPIALPLLDRVRHAAAAGEELDDGSPMEVDLDGEMLEPRARTIGDRARIFGDRARNFGGRRSRPAWEPRRIVDDYPTLRVPAGLPPVPPLALAVVALLVAALAILVVPGFLGADRGGGPDPSPAAGGLPAASPTARPSASAAAASVAPSERPRPRFRNYTVKAGDTFAQIARRFDLTVRQLRNANPKVRNPDRIRVGDRLRIPLRGAAAQQTPRPSGD